MTVNPYLTWVLALAMTFLGGCATPLYERLEDVTVGMDKTQVLDRAGTPKRIHRQKDSDIWTYTYYVGDRHFERDVSFESGHVVKISESREVHQDPAQEDLVVKDYEKLVNEKSKSKDSDAREKK